MKLSALDEEVFLDDAAEIYLNSTGASRRMTGLTLKKQLRVPCPVGILSTFDDMDTAFGSTAGAPWHTAASGTSAAISYLADAAHPGIHRASTGTTSTGYSRALRGASITSDQARLYLPGSDILYFEALVRVPNLPDGSQTYTAQIGLVAGYGGNTYSQALAQIAYTGGSAKWQLITRTEAGGTTTTDSTDVSPSANTWHRVRLDISTSAVDLYVDGTLHAENTGNLPDGGMAPAYQILKSAGSTARVLDVDYVWVFQEFATPRF